MTHGWERLDRLRLWDVATGKQVAAAIEGKKLNYVRGVRFSPEGHLLAAVEGSMRAGPSVHLWRVGKENGLLRVAMPDLRGEWDPVVCGDGRFLITMSEGRARRSGGE